MVATEHRPFSFSLFVSRAQRGPKAGFAEVTVRPDVAILYLYYEVQWKDCDQLILFFVDLMKRIKLHTRGVRWATSKYLHHISWKEHQAAAYGK